MVSNTAGSARVASERISGHRWRVADGWWWEWRLLSRSAAFGWAMLSLVTLSSLAFWSGWHRAEARWRAAIEAAEQNAVVWSVLLNAAGADAPMTGVLSAERLEELRLAADSPDLMVHWESCWTAAESPAALASLAVADSGNWPATYPLRGLSLAETLARPSPEALVESVGGPFDLNVLVAVVMPLVLMGLSYDLLAADRESGRLSWLAGRRSVVCRLVWRRGMIRLLAVVVAVVVPVLVGLAMLGWGNAVSMERAGDVVGAATALSLLAAWPAEWAEPSGVAAAWRMAAWSLAVAGYAAIWLLVAGVMQLGTRSAAANLLWLLILWAGLVLVVPAIVTSAIARLEPVADSGRYPAVEAAQLAAAKSQSRPLVERLLAEHPKWRQADAATVEYWAVQLDAAERFRRLLADDHQRHLGRSRRLAVWCWVSPALVWHQAATRLAGTGIERHVQLAAVTADRQLHWLRALAALSMEDRTLAAEDWRRLRDGLTNVALP